MSIPYDSIPRTPEAFGVFLLDTGAGNPYNSIRMRVEARAVDRLKALRGGGLPLPDDCRVRLVDLPVQAGGMIAVDESGFVNIYLNARLSLDAQRRALQHELRHYYRGDLYSEEDIRDIEARADAPLFQDIDGAPLDEPPKAFDPAGLRRVGRGLYRPTGENLDRAAAHIDLLRGLLLEACAIYDVMQTPPLLPREALADLAGALSAEDIAFVTWQRMEGQRPAVLHFSRDDLYGAIFYDPEGAPDNALAVMTPGAARLFVDMRRRRGRLEVFGITREFGRRTEKIY